MHMSSKKRPTSCSRSWHTLRVPKRCASSPTPGSAHITQRLHSVLFPVSTPRW